MEPDGLSVRRWLLLYGAWLLLLAAPAAALLARMDVGWGEFMHDPVAIAGHAEGALKLLIFAIVISVSCTFLPLPTGPMVSAVALRQFAPSENVWITALLVACVGAAASTMANLHDFHLFTWILRSQRIARVRQSRMYQRSARWFDRRPFALLVAFNVIPVPVDVVRMLAATHRYPLAPFAAANFLGRWVRYAVLAMVTFMLGRRGWMAVAFLLAAAVAMGLARLAWIMGSRAGARRANRSAVETVESARETRA